MDPSPRTRSAVPEGVGSHLSDATATAAGAGIPPPGQATEHARAEALATHRALVMAVAHALGVSLQTADQAAESLSSEFSARGLCLTRR